MIQGHTLRTSRRVRTFIVAILVMIMPATGSLASTAVNTKQLALEDQYRAGGLRGTMLIQSLDGRTEFIYNLADLSTGYVPASTFKIPNTLIALEENVIQDVDDVIVWDGVVRSYAPWNQDQTLKSAFKVSCVWCYQRFARQIGNQNYRNYLKLFHYGNQNTGVDIATFWLDGDLRISVRQQIAFLRRVYEKSLPVRSEHYQVLEQIMLSEDKGSYRIWSKTGWQGKDGWYVGYLQNDSQVWLFAHHLDIVSENALPLRRKLVMEALRLMGVIR